MLPIIYSDRFLDHDTGSNHPESAARLTAVVSALQKVPWHQEIDWRSPSNLTTRDALAEVSKVHDPKYIQRIKQIAEAGGGYLDPDTVVSPQSYKVALLAVNAWLDGVDAVIERGQPIFVLARPPGHHALRDRGMGFCLFANAAIAANYALQQPQISKVAILDWDVHHGNGTEAIVEANPQIRYCSLHQSPCYPGTGQASYHGQHNNIFNLPLPKGSTIKEYITLFTAEIIPWLEDFSPQLIIVSAGYDANLQDPLAGMALNPEDYGILTKQLKEVSSNLLFGLEGGYHLEALAQSIVATLASYK